MARGPHKGACWACSWGQCTGSLEGGGLGVCRGPGQRAHGKTDGGIAGRADVLYFFGVFFEIVLNFFEFFCEISDFSLKFLETGISKKHFQKVTVGAVAILPCGDHRSVSRLRANGCLQRSSSVSGVLGHAQFTGIPARPTRGPPPPPPRLYLYLWFAFVCFLIRSHPPSATPGGPWGPC